MLEGAKYVNLQRRNPIIHVNWNINDSSERIKRKFVLYKCAHRTVVNFTEKLQSLQ